MAFTGVITKTLLTGTTLPQTNIAPEHRPSKEISIPTIHFQVRTVSFREGVYIYIETTPFITIVFVAHFWAIFGRAVS